MTTANKEHYKYPYLLKDFRDDAGRVIIEQVNQVWSTDITYIVSPEKPTFAILS